MSDMTQRFQPVHTEFDSLADTQPVRVKRLPRKRKPTTIFLGLLLAFLIAFYFIVPFRTNTLILGMDRAPDGTDLARTDTMILVTVIPLEPYIGMLSIPRDLWVRLPEGGDNRINTAHFFAENREPGTGPQAAKDVVVQNFGVDVHYYIRFQFQGFMDFVDALGGIPIQLQESTAGYAPGEYVLNGEQALAFVRDRQGSDDFFRMDHGQFFLKAIVSHLIKPRNWIDLIQALPILLTSVDTNIPIWLWPRMGLALLRAGPEGMDLRIVSREMTQGITTTDGAQVLVPNWSIINPMLMEMFGQ